MLPAGDDTESGGLELGKWADDPGTDDRAEGPGEARRRRVLAGSAAAGPPSSAERSDFTPEEWLVLFPSPLPPLDAFGGIGFSQHADPAAALRASEPLTADAMLREFDHAVLHLAAILGLRSPLVWNTWLAAAAFALNGAMSLALLGTAAAWNDGRFTPTAIGVGIAAVALLFASLFTIFASAAVSWPPISSVMDFVAPAGMFRWLRAVRRTDNRQLQAKGNASAAVGGNLLQHLPDDPDCPCSSCLPKVQLFAGVLALLDEISNGAFFITMLFMMVFTPYVTFGGRIWTTWWSACIGVLNALFVLSFVFNTSGRFLTIANLAYAALERRLLRRATTLAMQDLIAACHDAASEADNSDGFRLLRGTGWLYAHLHYRFASVCRVRDKQDQAFVSRLVAITGFPAAIIGILLSITTGRCLPVWLLIFLPTQVLYFTVNAVHVASRNALLDTVAGVYRDAQRELRMLAVAAGPGPLADAIGLHDAAIASFLEASRYRAKMFGFTVGYGTVRTFLVTLVTVAVALWGVLRGFGVFVTVESFCPSEP